MRATGKCFKCNGIVPHTNLNKFYCSDDCRMFKLNKNISKKFEYYKFINLDLSEEEVKETFETWLKYNY